MSAWLSSSTARVGGSALAPLVCLVNAYRRRAAKWEARANHWFGVAMRGKPMLTEPQARRVIRDLFPRPMGARPREDALSLSTEQDVLRLRDWREHRALNSRDHTTRHHAEGSVPSEWATEVMQLCVGPLEVEGE